MVEPFEVNDDELYSAEKKYNALVHNHPLSLGRQLSSNERSRRALTESSLIYGETEFAPLAIALQKIQKAYGGLEGRGGRFVDVGAGLGKTLVAAAVCHNWDECVGLEILPDLVASGKMLCTRYKEIMSNAVGHGAAAAAAIRLEIVAADATGVDWSTADCVFINAMCFHAKLLERISAIADRMEAGTWAITVTRRLPSAEWAILNQQTFTIASGGSGTYYIHRKMAPPPLAAYFVGFTDGRVKLATVLLPLEKHEAVTQNTIMKNDTIMKNVFSVKKVIIDPDLKRDPVELLMGPSYFNAEKALNFKIVKKK